MKGKYLYRGFYLSNVRLFAIGSIILAIALFGSCKKDPGQGGTSTISGKLKVLDYDLNPISGYWELNREYYGPDIRVYIIYGDDEVYSDDFRTDPNGNFEFKWLRKGDYTIFAFSDDTTGNIVSGVESISMDVKISKNREKVTVEDLVVID